MGKGRREAAELIGKLAEAVNNPYKEGHRPCLRDCLGSLQHSLLDDQQGDVIDRVIAVVAAFRRPAQPEERAVRAVRLLGTPGSFDVGDRTIVTPNAVEALECLTCGALLLPGSSAAAEHLASHREEPQ